MREELVMRNVSRLAELPTWERKPVTPWTAAEVRAFLEAAKDDALSPAFVLLLLYGLRRDEVLGLRWRDVDDEDGELRVCQHIQRVHGELRIGPVKVLLAAVTCLCSTWPPRSWRPATLSRPPTAPSWAAPGRDTGLIFTTRTGWPIEPRNMARSFHRICRAHGLREINVHHVRHTTATLLKNLGVPARDAQLILGHSRLAVTLEIYTHGDRKTLPHSAQRNLVDHRGVQVLDLLDWPGKLVNLAARLDVPEVPHGRDHVDGWEPVFDNKLTGLLPVGDLVLVRETAGYSERASTCPKYCSTASGTPARKAPSNSSTAALCSRTSASMASIRNSCAARASCSWRARVSSASA
jgi:hypothetical protein